MRTFSFRLERLRTLAEGERQLRAQELASAQAVAASAREELERRAQARRAHLEEAREPDRPEPLDLDQWSAGQANYQLLRGSELQAAHQLAAARDEEDAARGAYLEARKQDRTLERVRERRKAAWDLEAQRSEQSLLDDENARRGGQG